MVIAYLGLGSNLGDREGYLRAAVEALGKLRGTRVLATSGLYCSKPWGKLDQPDFMNMVAAVETEMEPRELLGECKSIERAAGRTAGERWGPRVLDIDLLLYDGLTLDSDALTIPHPRLWQRQFVLMPLAELVPGLRDGHGRSILEVLKCEAIETQGVWPCGALESKGVHEDG
ncbi:MAG TPA: 2-amino-4-hydroxy-6-hydroxymethyldihydropteridine diphosphokinase [Chloroflexia bacterium]|nr:2-amino-4-hydroxy-6-hydroxymethyldihydropteridine diphosphokinase [Chloroflexia bacterium]